MAVAFCSLQKNRAGIAPAPATTNFTRASRDVEESYLTSTNPVQVRRGRQDARQSWGCCFIPPVSKSSHAEEGECDCRNFALQGFRRLDCLPGLRDSDGPLRRIDSMDSTCISRLAWPVTTEKTLTPSVNGHAGEPIRKRLKPQLAGYLRKAECRQMKNWQQNTMESSMTNTGFRPGEGNHMTKHPDAVVRRARLLHARGYGPADIRRHLADEGHDIQIKTVQTWVRCNTRLSA